MHFDKTWVFFLPSSPPPPFYLSLSDDRNSKSRRYIEDSNTEKHDEKYAWSEAKWQITSREWMISDLYLLIRWKRPQEAVQGIIYDVYGHRHWVVGCVIVYSCICGLNNNKYKMRHSIIS